MVAADRGAAVKRKAAAVRIAKAFIQRLVLSCFMIYLPVQ
jgi:hypothetical protein